MSGSGKTTCYRSLAGAYHYIRELRALGKHSQSTSKKAPQARSNGGISIESGNDYPCVDITVINPAIYSYNEVSKLSFCFVIYIYTCMTQSIILFHTFA